jgi:nucleobase:cation symporter-1, NCS1 family
VPWIVLSSAKKFLSFMSAYAIFMAPMAGILFADYWLVKRRRYDVPALYDPAGTYRYGRWCVNWRSLVVVLVTVVPLLPALAWKVNLEDISISGGLKNLFAINWLYGSFLSTTLYWVLNLVFPDAETLIFRVVTGVLQNEFLEGVEAGLSSVSTDDSSSIAKEAKAAVSAVRLG